MPLPAHQRLKPGPKPQGKVKCTLNIMPDTKRRIQGSAVMSGMSMGQVVDQLVKVLDKEVK